MLEKLKSFNFFYLIRHKSLHNFIFLFIIQSSNVLISLISMPLLIQALGVDQFGLVNLALSVTFLANVGVSFGYNLSGPREIAINQENKSAMSAVASKVFFSKVLLALSACIIIMILVFGFDFFSEYQVILVFSLLLLFSEATASTWFFQGLEKMRMASVANVISKVLYLLALILFINQPDDAKWVNLLLGITALGVNLLLLSYIHHELEIKIFLPKMGEVILSWKENFTLFLSTIGSHISVHGGLIILSFFASASILGMYSMAERISMVLRMAPTLIAQAVYPNASKLYQYDIHLFYGFMKKIYWGALGISLFITLFVLIFAPGIIRIISRNEFESSIQFLRILSFVPFLASLNMANMIMILVADQKNTLLNTTWIMCCYMVIAASVLTYLFGGKGLAYSLLSMELIIFAVCSVLIRKKSPEIFNGFYRRAFGSHYSR
ncbi:MAG: oligosaccharide flippase family protein [Anditalea sp.]